LIPDEKLLKGRGAMGVKAVMGLTRTNKLFSDSKKVL
jgi:hypothetical protein